MKQRQIGLAPELVIDNFAGGGGASTGIAAALGREVDIAVNHDGAALAAHAANHPNTRHLCGDVFDVNPLEVTRGQPVGLAWFSPDCTHFSKAKGGKPRSKKIRGLAWVAVKWAATVRPRVIMLENVEEFQTWGPLTREGVPNPDRKGLTYRRWVREFEKLGYQLEARMMRACDYGAPTTRRRLFVVARCDGRPIVWPAESHGPDRPEPYHTAGECIDWAIPCPSIFERKKPLAEATQRRIARGIFKYVLNTDAPYIVATQQGPAAPWLNNTRNGERPGQAPRVRSLEDPAPTVTAVGSQGALVSAFLAKHYGGHETPGSSLARPVDTITAQDHHALVTSNLVKLRGTGTANSMAEPLHTITAGGLHYGEVRAFLMKYYGQGIGQSLDEPAHTLTSKARLGLVTIGATEYRITDIGMRMLQPRELYRAQGFPESYVIDPHWQGKPLTKTNQIRLCGNSVAPPVAAALVSANFAHEAAYSEELTA